MTNFAITAIGIDRPGIVAGVTQVLYRLNCNIEDTQMTILRGHFAMMLIVSAPDEVDESALESELGPVRKELSLEAVVARKVGEAMATEEKADHVLTVYGADHPGIVHAVTKALAGMGVNITDLNTRLVGEPQSPLYAMMLELCLPLGVDEDAVKGALESVGKEIDVEVSLRQLSSDTL